jgi:PKD repeat protein
MLSRGHITGMLRQLVLVAAKTPRRAVVVFLALAAGSLAYGIANAATGPTVSINAPNSHRYFSPDGDRQDDTTTVYYCLSEAANVTVTVTDSAGGMVRTVEDGVSHPGSPGCSYWNNYFDWDGKADSGAVVADGVYVVHLHAIDAAGQTTDDSVQVGVDTRTPGSLTAPAPNDTLSGTVNWTFTPTAGFPVSSVDVSCSGTGLGSSSSAKPDGTFTGSGDTSRCTAGSNTMTANVGWTDPFGVGHGWSAPPMPVTINNPPTMSIWSNSHRYFSPNGDGQDDATTVYYCLSKNSKIDATVTGPTGATVRTIKSAEPTTGYPGCSYWNNYFDWDGKADSGAVVADGVYVVHLHAIDAAGQTTDDSVQVGVDTRTPGTLAKPKPGDTLAGLANLVFQPTAGYPITQISAYFDTGGGATIYNASPDGLWRTSLYTGSLRSGPAVLHTYVTSTDPFGASHTWTAADTPIVIDVTSLPLTVSAAPATGPAPLATTLHIDTSDPQARTVHYAVSFGDGTAAASGDISAPYATVDVAHTYTNPGVYRAVVTVTNSAGAASTRAIDITATGSSNTAPMASLALDTSSGVVPLPVTMTVGGTDADNDPLTFTLDYGDGTAIESGNLPHAAFAHTYIKAGTYLVRLAASDGRQTSVKTTTVVVGLAEPLAANGGDDQVIMAGSAAHFDGAASRPQLGIERYQWDFGDGATAESATADHVYDQPGTYTAKLTVTADGKTATDTAVVTVTPVPTESGLTVTVTSDNAPAAGADLVVIDAAGQRFSATTDATGKGHLHGLPDGPYTVYVWKDGYTPTSVQATVTNDTGSANVDLKRGEVATSTVTSTPMTYDEIEAAGIDPTAPENQHVYQFEIHLAFTPTTTSDLTVTGLVSGSGTGGGGFPTGISVGGTGKTCTSVCSFSTPDYSGTVSVQWVNNEPQLLWLIIPGKASWLKEFFNVQMMVTNLASPGFVLDHGAATLPLPSGLSLAPTATPQKATVALPDIEGGHSATASWVVRGDVEGYYDLTSSYAGSLEPFGKSVNLTAVAQNKLHVWGGSALKMTVDADADVYDRYPYRVRIGLKNVADVPVYNATVELLKQGKLNYIYQPREALQQATAEIAPGDTFWTDDYILAPEITGTLDLAHSFVRKTAGDVDLPDTIVSHPPLRTPETTPLLQAVGLNGAVGLLWEEVPGATSYEIYRTSDRQTDFPDIPLATVAGDVTQKLVQTSSTTPEWYAVSSIINGRRTMVHPIVRGQQNPSASPVSLSTDLTSQASCGHDIGVTVNITSLFFNLTRYEVTLNGAPYASGSLSGRAAKVTLPTVTAKSLSDADKKLVVTAYDESGGAPATDQTILSIKCNPIKLLVLGDSIAWGQGLNDDDKYPEWVADWLRGQTTRPVEYEALTDNIAHSGATVASNGSCSPDFREFSGSSADGEVPFSTPDIQTCQRQAAAAHDADVILVDGCINDVGALNIPLNPTVDLTTAVEEKCSTPVETLLKGLHYDHPNAQIVYTGYYRIFDKNIPLSVAAELASMVGLPKDSLPYLISTGPATRSEQFLTLFNSTAKQVVSKLDSDGTWLHFADPQLPVGSGLGDFGTTQLWPKLGFADWPFDDRAGDRAWVCSTDANAFRIWYQMLELKSLACTFASVGHPNKEGARSYAVAITDALSIWTASQRHPKSLAFSPASMQVPRGDIATYSVRAIYDTTHTSDATGLVTVTTSDPAAVTVDPASSTIKAVGAVGSQATITATLVADPTVKTTMTVTVTAPVPKSIALTPANPLVIVKKSVQMKAVATLSDGTTRDVTSTAQSQWTSSNVGVATVSRAGLVSSVAVGTTSISAKYTVDGVSASGQTVVTVLSGTPKVTSFSPASGPIGTKVVIQGTNLLGATSVSFGGVVATQFTVDSSSQITAVVPAGAKSGVVQVVTPLGTAKSSKKFTVR